MPSVQYCFQVMVTSAWWECAKRRELPILLINTHPGYLTNGTFPMFRLIKDRISSGYINDNVPGRVLDELFDLNVSKVYFERAIKVVRYFASTCNALNLEEAPPYTIRAEQFFKRCWKANHLFNSSLSIFTSILLSVRSLIIRLSHSWTFPVCLLTFMDVLYVSYQVCFLAKRLIA